MIYALGFYWLVMGIASCIYVTKLTDGAHLKELMPLFVFIVYPLLICTGGVLVPGFLAYVVVDKFAGTR